MHYLSFTTRSISYSATLIAAARLTGVTPGFNFAGAKRDLPIASRYHHLHDGVFHAFMFHGNPPLGQRLRGRWLH